MAAVAVTIPNTENSPQHSIPAEPATSESCLDKILFGILIVIFGIVYIVISPIYIPVSLYIFSKKHLSEPSSIDNDNSLYEKVIGDVQKTANQVAAFRYSHKCSKLLLVTFPWVIWNSLTYYSPKLKKKFGKWSLLVTVIWCGYPLLSLTVDILIYFLCKIRKLRKMNVDYYAGGLIRSFSFFLYSGLLLLSWAMKRMPVSDVLFRVGIWSFVTLVIASLLWTLKSVLLLFWEANVVYNRFRNRVLRVGTQLYFLFYIFGLHTTMFQPTNVENKARDILFTDDEEATINHIKEMSQYFIRLSKLSSREDDDIVSAQCKQITPNNPRNLTEEDFSQFGLEENDARILLSSLRVNGTDLMISYENFEKSMIKAHKNCVELGHTLFDAKEVVKVLDRVLTGVLLGIVIVAWLLLTDFASTKIVVLMVSPLLAATFIFGDTCKKIFEGIIFAFISHPFDVGDLCIIEESQLEVKRISVLATTFRVIGTKQEKLYPNSALVALAIVNLKGEPDPNDQVELTLFSNYNKSVLDKMQDKITHFFKNDQKYEDEATIVIKEMGESSVNMVIHYQHVLSIHETTHSQCFKKKRKEKSNLLLIFKHFTENINGEDIEQVREEPNEADTRAINTNTNTLARSLTL